MKYSIAILAGGTSKRMGSDKAQLPFENVTLLQHIKSICEKQTDELMICSNNAHHKLDNSILIPDIIENIGPLGGLIPAIEYCKHDWLVVIPCDTPFINASFFSEIGKRLSQSSTKPVIPISAGQPQYLCAAYHKSILEIWKEQITTNNFSVKHNLTKANCIFVNMDVLGENTFKNINTLEEYQSILK